MWLKVPARLENIGIGLIAIAGLIAAGYWFAESFI